MDAVGRISKEQDVGLFVMVFAKLSMIFIMGHSQRSLPAVIFLLLSQHVVPSTCFMIYSITYHCRSLFIFSLKLFKTVYDRALVSV